MNDDTQLLQRYVRDGSEAAFHELVGRHIGLVFGTARRLVAGDIPLAQDVTQVVFTDLARKAATLPIDTVLGGWLYRHTCYTASKAVRTEQRRRRRETTAMEMHSLHEDPGPDPHWPLLAPVLDEALGTLDAADRNALVLRYLQQHDLRRIAATLGLSEDAVQKRIARALDKLRALLVRRGLSLSAALLATTLDSSALTAAPPGLAASVSAGALAVGKTAFTLASLKIMAASKLGLSLATAVAVISLTAVLVSRHHPSAPPPSPADFYRFENRPVADASAVARTPAVSAAPAPTGASSAVVATGQPGRGSSSFSSSTVRIANGAVITTTNNNGVVSTQTQPIGANGSMSGSAGNSAFWAGNGTPQLGGLPFPTPTGAPTSSTLNPDGSTTLTYAGQNGGTVEMTVSPDGRARSIRSVSPAPPPPTP